ncbi:hypothetical protein BAUCODRAFT_547758 [Baudoinia panamericana UAMH 10762]|uniref:Apple domain-containing protein n=1 Tax=Baudoinia panamericana (strain UAMH 10762) TaxID=717646 RepID=M2LJL5_BAUPA|nr:uncharacterized protein BAUCODRAFT_547758 [Baudoinia panamericana UAMH 10762]EMC94417.1 hypothetical protein BAUCODRAFT_547758 [Baudoinia panamericana UAMH 10762]
MARIPLVISALFTTVILPIVAVAQITTTTTTPDYACPAVNGQTVVDPSGVSYIIQCSGDTSIGNYGVASTMNGFDDCFYNCSNQLGDASAQPCYSFTFWSPFFTNGVGQGTCFYQHQPGGSTTFVRSDNYHVAAIQVAQYGGGAFSLDTTSTSTSSTSATVDPMPTTASTTSESVPSYPQGGTSSSSSSTTTDSSSTTTDSSSITTDSSSITTDSSSITTDSSSTTTDSSSITTDSRSITTDSSSITMDSRSITTDSSSTTTDSSSITTDSSSITTGSSSTTTDSSSITTGSSSTTTDSSSITTDSSFIMTDSSSITTDSSSITTDSSSITTDSSSITTDSSSITTDSSSITTDSSSITTDSSSTTMEPPAYTPSTSGGLADNNIPTVVLLSTSSMQSGSSSSSSAITIPTVGPYACPSNDGQTVVDSNGQSYVLRCGCDTSNGDYHQFSAESFNDCFLGCDDTTLGPCYGWTFLYTLKTSGAGTCFLKNFATESFIGCNEASKVAGIRPANLVTVTSSSLSVASKTLSVVSSPTASIQCPGGSDNMPYTDSYGIEYIIFCDSDTQPPSDGPGVQTPDFPSCINMCATQGQTCVAVTWNNGMCYFKESFSNTVSSSGIDSAVLQSVLPPNDAYGDGASGSSSSSSMSSTVIASTAASTGSSSSVMSPPMGSSTSTTSVGPSPYASQSSTFTSSTTASSPMAPNNPPTTPGLYTTPSVPTASFSSSSSMLPNNLSTPPGQYTSPSVPTTSSTLSSPIAPANSPTSPQYTAPSIPTMSSSSSSPMLPNNPATSPGQYTSPSVPTSTTFSSPPMLPSISPTSPGQYTPPDVVPTLSSPVEISTSPANSGLYTPPSVPISSSSPNNPDQYAPPVESYYTTSSLLSTSQLPACGASATGTATAAGSNNTCADAFGNTFNVTTNTIYAGHIQIRAAKANLGSCLTFCDTTPGCRAANYNPTTSQCELLDTVTGTTTVTGTGPPVQAATRPVDVATVYTAPPSVAAMTTTSSSSGFYGINTPGPAYTGDLNGVSPIPSSSNTPASDATMNGGGYVPPNASLSGPSLYSTTPTPTSNGGDSNVPTYPSGSQGTNSVSLVNSVTPASGGGNTGSMPGKYTTTNGVSGYEQSSASSSSSGGGPSFITNYGPGPATGGVGGVSGYNSGGGGSASSSSSFQGTRTGATIVSYSLNGSSATGSSSTPTAAVSEGPPCPAYNGGSYTDENYATYSVSCNESYTGTTYASYSSKHKRQISVEHDADNFAQACMARCDAVEACVAISSTSTACTLFSSVTGLATEDGSVAALKVTAPSGAYGGGEVVTVTISSCPTQRTSTLTTTATLTQTCPASGCEIVGMGRLDGEEVIGFEPM